MPSQRFDLYAFPSGDLEEARRFVEAELGVHLRPRDSGYLGEYYSLRLPDDGHIGLWCDDVEDASEVVTHAASGVLLELARLPEMDALRDRLLAAPGIALIRSRTIDVPDDESDPDHAGD